MAENEVTNVNIPSELDVDLDVDQSYSDEARIREAELTHDLESQKLAFDRERFYNAIPKSDKELELMYAYKNRLLDRQMAEDAYKRTPAYKREKYTVGGAIVVALGVLGKFIWDMCTGGDKK